MTLAFLPIGDEHPSVMLDTNSNIRGGARHPTASVGTVGKGSWALWMLDGGGRTHCREILDDVDGLTVTDSRERSASYSIDKLPVAGVNDSDTGAYAKTQPIIDDAYYATVVPDPVSGLTVMDGHQASTADAILDLAVFDINEPFAVIRFFAHVPRMASATDDRADVTNRTMVIN